MADQYRPPEQALILTSEQVAVVTEPTRNAIIMMLSQRPASITELADALDRPKGTVGHHVKALEEAGLIRVVRARRVRAVVEKFYGRVARTFVFPAVPGVEGTDVHPFVAEAITEGRDPRGDEASLVTIRHARIPDARADEFAERLLDLAEEFAGFGPGGTTTYGLLIGLYPTDRPSLSDGDDSRGAQ